MDWRRSGACSVARATGAAAAQRSAADAVLVVRPMPWAPATARIASLGTLRTVAEMLQGESQRLVGWWIGGWVG